MEYTDEQVLKDVRFILKSGDAGIIHTLKVTIPAYLECIAVNRQCAELSHKKEA